MKPENTSVIALGSGSAIAKPETRSHARFLAYADAFASYQVVVYGKNEEWSDAEGKKKVCVVSDEIKPLLPFQLFWKLFLATRSTKGLRLITVQDPFVLGVIAYIVSWITGTPLHVQVHVDLSSRFFREASWYNRFQVLLAHFVLPRAQAVRVVSEETKEWILHNTKTIKPITVLPIARHEALRKVSEKEITSLRESLDMPRLVLLGIGRFVTDKRFDDIISAFSKTHSKHQDIHLVLVGNGPEKENLKALVQEKDISSVVTFIDWTEDIALYYAASDIFVSASLYEGWGMAIEEAASFKNAILTTRVGCVATLFDEESVFIIRPGDKKALTRGMKNLVSDNDLRQKLQKKSYTKVITYLKEYTWEEYRQKLIASFLDTL